MINHEYIESVLQEALEFIKKNISDQKSNLDIFKSDFEIVQDIESYIEHMEFGLAFENLVEIIKSSEFSFNGALLYNLICVSIMMNCSVSVDNEKFSINCV